MIARRNFLLSSLALSLAPVWHARAEPVPGEDGLYSEPWFLQSFLAMPVDLAAADAEDKRYAIMWELRGCPYCKETHLVNFAQPRILEYIKSNFEVLQLNILGARQVTDFDGEVLADKDLARKYDVRYTPTFQFFGEDPAKLKALPPKERSRARGRLSAARRLPQPIPLRAREGLHAAELAQLPEGPRRLSALRSLALSPKKKASPFPPRVPSCPSFRCPSPSGPMTARAH
jgi:thiol-disulfide isomerase/thioredoxin